MTSGKPSVASATSTLPKNAKTTSQQQDMGPIKRSML
jgi:hypothetical protein